VSFVLGEVFIDPPVVELKAASEQRVQHLDVVLFKQDASWVSANELADNEFAVFLGDRLDRRGIVQHSITALHIMVSVIYLLP
jgi:hypothetical protein